MEKNTENNNPTIKYFSLFSGIGGFEYGIQQSKYKDKLICVGYSEIDKYADSIYRKRFPNKVEKGTETHKPYGDVREINTADLPNFELLVGGFPCQAFSHAGKRRGFDDTRGTLFFEIARILKDKRPRYFLLENVKGLLSHNKGETFKTILEILSSLGYDVKWEIFNSKNYGVPQNRERIYIKGYLRGKCGGEILHFRDKDEKSNDELNNKKLIKLNKKSQAQTVYDPKGLSCTLSANGGGDGGKTGMYLVDNPKIKKLNNATSQSQMVYSIDGIAPTLCGSSSGDGRATGMYLVDDPKIEKIGNFSNTNHHGGNVYSSDGLSPTICGSSVIKNGLHIIDKKEPKIEIVGNTSVTKHGGEKVISVNGLSSTLTHTNYKHPITILEKDKDDIDLTDKCIRKLTPVECERLQGLPDNWTQYGVDGELISNTQRYKCIGNAVTVNVIKHIFDNWDLYV